MNDQTRTPDSITFEEHDEFQRKPIAEKLLKLLTSDINVSPMVIDGHWGTGKTEFCYKLINLLKETHPDVHVAYVDAFKADHANEPLMTLVAAIANLIDDEETEKSFREKAIPALRYGLKTLGKAGIAWLLKKNADEIPDEFEDILQEAAEDSINAAIEQSIKDHQDIEAVLTTLQEALERIAEEKPLILFVDELDRCKPDFAIAMLESIKHVFDVPNVQFVLVSNLKQLKDSINHCYGVGINAQRYLDKFVSYTLVLPDELTQNRHNYVLASIEYTKLLIEKSGTLAESYLAKEGTFKFIETLIKENQLSLREVETFIRHLEVAQILGGATYFSNTLPPGRVLLNVLGVFIYCFNKDIAELLIRGSADAKQITKVLGIEEFPDRDSIGPYPSPEQVVSTLLFYSLPVGVPGIPEDNSDDDRFWKGVIGDYFQGSLRHSMDGYYVKIITDTIRLLRME